MITSENPGGSEGGLKLSELRLLRQNSRYPISDADRQAVVESVMNTLRTAKRARYKIAAAKTIAMLDGVNLKELQLILDAELLKQSLSTEKIQVVANEAEIAAGLAAMLENVREKADDSTGILARDTGIVADPAGVEQGAVEQSSGWKIDTA